MQAYAIRLTLGSHPGSPYATPLVKRYVRYGASPRAAQALVLAAKIQALNRGQAFVSIDDIRARGAAGAAPSAPAEFEGEADEVNTDTIVDRAAWPASTALNQEFAIRDSVDLRTATTVHAPSFEDDFLKKLEYLHVVSQARVRGAESRRSADAQARPRASSSPTTGRTPPATTSGTSTGRPTSG